MVFFYNIIITNSNTPSILNMNVFYVRSELEKIFVISPIFVSLSRTLFSEMENRSFSRRKDSLLSISALPTTNPPASPAKTFSFPPWHTFSSLLHL